MNVNIYIKIAFHGNPVGEGKAVAVLECSKKNGEVHTRMEVVEHIGTKNQLILKICIESIQRLKFPCSVCLYLNDTYVKGILTRNLLEKWEQNEWRKATGKEPANLFLWKKLYQYLGYHKIIIEAYQPKYDTFLTNTLERREYGNNQ